MMEAFLNNEEPHIKLHAQAGGVGISQYDENAYNNKQQAIREAMLVVSEHKDGIP